MDFACPFFSSPLLHSLVFSLRVDSLTNRTKSKINTIFPPPPPPIILFSFSLIASATFPMVYRPADKPHFCQSIDVSTAPPVHKVTLSNSNCYQGKSLLIKVPGCRPVAQPRGGCRLLHVQMTNYGSCLIHMLNLKIAFSCPTVSI